MKNKEIKEELSLSIRSFIEAKEQSQQESIDEFDELRILETAFNRLFIAIEHLCNAILLLEKGNFSKKHFGDITKLRELKEKYTIDLANTYQTTYTFRSYADYRKHPEIAENFNRSERELLITWLLPCYGFLLHRQLLLMLNRGVILHIGSFQTNKFIFYVYGRV